MKCEELRKKLNEVQQKETLLHIKLRPEEEDHLKTFLIDVDLKDYSARELKNMTMSLSRSKDQKSFAYLFPKLSENELKEINQILNELDQTSYNLASEYKFCVLDRFSKQSNFEPDTKIVELTQTTKPNIIKTLKAIQIENETEEARRHIENPIYGLNGPVRREEVRPYIEKALAALEPKNEIKEEVVEHIIRLFNLFDHRGERSSKIRGGCPTANYRTLEEHLSEYRMLQNMTSLAESIDLFIKTLSSENTTFKHNWIPYLRRISAGLRYWEAISMDCFDLCVIGQITLQDEIKKTSSDLVQDAWEDVIQDVYSVASILDDIEIEPKTPKYIHPYTLDRDYVHKAIIKRY